MREVDSIPSFVIFLITERGLSSVGLNLDMLVCALLVQSITELV